MPLGFLTETPDGRGKESHPEFAELYGATEHPSPEWKPRTYANAAQSDGTIWLGSGDSLGFGCTMNGCRMAGNRPVFKVMTRGVKPGHAAAWIAENGIRALNVAGGRESKNPGIGERAEAFLVEVFRILEGGV